MALIKEYFALTEKYSAEYGPNTVVGLQVGAFFEVYGQKITPAAGGGVRCAVCCVVCCVLRVVCSVRGVCWCAVVGGCGSIRFNF